MYNTLVSIDEIIDKLKNELLPALDNNFEDINWGGCGIFALTLWNRLKELEIENIEAHMLIYDDSQFDNVVERIKRTNQGEDPEEVYDEIDDSGFTHIILSIYHNNKYYLIDVKGIEEVYTISENMEAPNHFSDDDDGKFGPTLDYDSLKLLAENTKYGLWNSDFNRNEIPKIKRMIEEFQF